MIERAFRPILRLAWPKPSIDRLLRTALLEDPDGAAKAWREFESLADFDRLTVGEVSGLGLVASRLKIIAPNSPMRARIEGIERAIWSQSQLAIGAAGPALRALEAKSISVLVINDAARPGALRCRGADRVDIVVRAVDIEAAFDCLAADGWQPSAGTVMADHRGRPVIAISNRLAGGRPGNLRLYRTAFANRKDSAADDASIWQRSLSGKIAGSNVRLPSPSDAVAITLAGGMLNARNCGAWLADIAARFDAGVDWALLQELAERHILHVPGAVACRYLQERLDRPVPESLMQRLEGGARNRPLALLADLARTRPTTPGLSQLRSLRAAAIRRRLFAWA